MGNNYFFMCTSDIYIIFLISCELYCYMWERWYIYTRYLFVKKGEDGKYYEKRKTFVHKYNLTIIFLSPSLLTIFFFFFLVKNKVLIQELNKYMISHVVRKIIYILDAQNTFLWKNGRVGKIREIIYMLDAQNTSSWGWGKIEKTRKTCS